MSDLKWSSSEKKIARRAFDVALQSALAKAMAEFKAKAVAARTPEEMWAVEGYLRKERRKLDEQFDYRYSQLVMGFARLIRENLLDEAQLSGLSEDKLEIIRHILGYFGR